MYINSNSMIVSTIKSALPAYNNGRATYDQISKMFLSSGWQSAAGNVYLEGARVSNNLVVKYNIGYGYCYKFLNGINLYAYDGNRLKLIASDNSYYNFVWNDSLVRSETIGLLQRMLLDQCRIAGCRIVNMLELERIASGLIDETIKSTEAAGNQLLASSGSHTLLLR